VKFLGEFEKLRKSNNSFVMLIPPSFCPYGTTRLTLDGLEKKSLIFEYFSKSCRENSSFIKIGQD